MVHYFFLNIENEDEENLERFWINTSWHVVSKIFEDMSFGKYLDRFSNPLLQIEKIALRSRAKIHYWCLVSLYLRQLSTFHSTDASPTNSSKEDADFFEWAYYSSLLKFEEKQAQSFLKHSSYISF